MTLTEPDKILIARRAAGDYSVIPAVRKLLSEQKKNRIPYDQVFLNFARLTMKKSWDWDDYYERVKEILEIIPEPFGPPGGKEASRPKRKKKAKKAPRRKGAATGLMGLLDSG